MKEILRDIYQTGRETFVIEWSDGQSATYRLSELEHLCPCIECRGKSKIEKTGLSARLVSNVGAYALRIDFTEGCSKGIFTYAFLRKLGGVQ